MFLKFRAPKKPGTVKENTTILESKMNQIILSEINLKILVVLCSTNTFLALGPSLIFNS